MHLFQHLMAGVAHIDAEHVDAGIEQGPHHRRCVGGRAQGGEDFCFPAAAHKIMS